MSKKKLLIFASGKGTNFEAIVKYFKNSPDILIELLSDKKDAPVLNLAKKYNIKSYFVQFEDIIKFLKDKNYELYILSGFMRILPEEVINKGKFLNIHPSILPLYKGKDAIKRAFKDKKETGVTIHYVTKEVDSGGIIIQKKVDSYKTLEELEEKIHNLEHKIYPKIIENELNKKNILIIGSGAREHVLTEKIKQSEFLNKLYLANPNDGFKNSGEIIEYKDYEELAQISKSLGVDYLVVGPENPMAEGIVDIFLKKGIKAFGCDKYFSQLESKKSFAKELMQKFNIKTAPYITVNKIDEIDNALKNFSSPPVIKADGLCMGKGVYIPDSFHSAKEIIIEFLKGKFNDASKKVILEKRLYGDEFSLFSLYDGKNLVHFPYLKDYKKEFDNNKGKNTGGMGSYAPHKIKSDLSDYKINLLKMLNSINAYYKGIVYSGLIETDEGVYVLEYNVRFGDPEIQSLMQLIENDFIEIIEKTVNSKLNELDLKIKNDTAYTVIMASKGYPDNPKKGAEIKNIQEVKEKHGVKIYYSGVKITDDKFYASGGRVLSVTKTGKNALSDIYNAICEIEYKDKKYRHDIGD